MLELADEEDSKSFGSDTEPPLPGGSIYNKTLPKLKPAPGVFILFKNLLLFSK